MKCKLNCTRITNRRQRSSPAML